jgi:hypothetical protein
MVQLKRVYSYVEMDANYQLSKLVCRVRWRYKEEENTKDSSLEERRRQVRVRALG